MNIDSDLSSIDSGVWFQFKNAKFLVAHMSSMKFQRAVSRGQQPHRRKIEQGTCDPQVLKDITCKAMAEGLLLDWKGVKNKDGAEVAFSQELAAKVLARDPELRDFISECSMNLENFREEEVEELGNSSSIG